MSFILGGMGIRIVALISCFILLSATGRASDVPCYVEGWKSHADIKWSAPARYPVSVPFSLSFKAADRKTLWWFNRPKDQHGQWWGQITPDGKVVLNINFTNGSRIDGDHFAVVLTLRDKDGKVLIDREGKPALAQFKAGLDAKGYCHARGKNYRCYKRTASVPILLDPVVVKSLAFVEQRHGFHDKVDDVIFWKDVKSVAQCIALM